MEVSTFELLFKPILERPPVSNPGFGVLSAVGRRIVQGYFLSISNLEDKDYTFRVEFTISLPDAALPAAEKPDRLLDNNASITYDVGGINNRFTPQRIGTSNRYQAFFVLPAKQTGSLALLPLAGVFLNQPAPQFEVRGFVSLFLPALLRFEPPRIRFVPQSDRPVNVLLNPETRGTALPNTFPAQLEGDFDQINTSLNLASGRALNQIPPEPGRPFFLEPVDIPTISQRLQELVDSGQLDLMLDEPVTSTAMLAGLLTGVDEQTREELNKRLAELGVQVTLEQRE